MADMELVIKIPKDIYEDIKESGICGYWSDLEIVSEAISNGTVLPKGHGKIIDANDLDKILRPINPTDAECAVTMETAIKLIHDAFNKMPTIIEADKGE